MGKKLDLVGQRFGRLVVIREAGRDRYGAVLWLCKCDCWTEVTVRGSSLKSGHTTSCGCYDLDRKTTHGMHKTRLHRIWVGMLARSGIYKGASKKSRRTYIDRGITVCEEWLVFENFRDWALSNGYADDLELDRIDNEKGYSPENCHWVTRKENCSNRRNTLRLEDGTPLAVFCTEVGIETCENGKKSPVYGRIQTMYLTKRKIHPELLQAANERIALYHKTLELLKLQEDVRRFAAEVALISKNEANILP